MLKNLVFIFAATVLEGPFSGIDKSLMGLVDECLA